MKRALKLLGPGLLYAGAAVGVSHLVQSTRAGSEFGFGLIWAVILANIIKYPFFQYGPRYASGTGKSLLEGYQELGTWALVVFVLMTLGSMFIIQAAVTIVTAGLAIGFFGADISATYMSLVILVIAVCILGFGKFSALDKSMKVIIVLLSLTTVLTLVLALFGPSVNKPGPFPVFEWTNSSHLLLLVVLMGWMPAPLDISVWHSVWTIEKNTHTEENIGIKQSLLDFNIGYWGTAVLAIVFFSLGAIMIYGTGTELSSKGSVFASQLTGIYTTVLGKGAWWVISLAALFTMISTTLTCLDAFPRVLSRSFELLVPHPSKLKAISGNYWFWIIFTASGSLVILFWFTQNMKGMVNFATTLSFVTAPIVAGFNFWVIMGKNVPKEVRPGKFLQLFSIIGIFFLTLFTLYYLIIL